jgi:hypothetical protein
MSLSKEIIPYADKDIFDAHFRDLKRSDNHEKWKEGKDQVICSCGKVMAKQSHGYTNGSSHVKTQHDEKEYVEKVQELLRARRDGQVSILLFNSIPKDAKNMHDWIDWIVMDNLPFCFVEKKRTRKNTSLNPICVNTFMKYLRLLTTAVEPEIAEALPDKFGLILDGWTENSIHFCVLFACIPGTCDRIMLTFSPLLDPTTQDVDAHYDWIVEILGVYSKGVGNILFLCSDNTNCMPALARKLKCPFIGCASHRLALYVKKYLNCDDDDETHLLNKLKTLMKKLRSANKSAAILMETHLKPITSNVTRWSSTYHMVCRYNQIKDVINRSDRDLVDFLLTPSEDIKLADLEGSLKKLDDITVAMQGASVNLDDCRVFLDGVIDLNIMDDQIASVDESGKRIIHEYGRWETEYLTENCRIAANPLFEIAVVKILRGKESELTDQEKKEVSELEVGGVVTHSNLTPLVSTGNYASDLQLRAKRSKVEKAKYMDLRFVPATSDVAERSFSDSGMVYNEMRQGMTPYHLECVLFLKHNRLYWNESLVAKIYNE